jgi:zinc protease
MTPRLRRFLVGLVTSAIVLLPGAVARAQAIPAEDRIPLDPAIRAGTLPNGLRYYIRHNTRPEKRLELRLVVNAGSVLEDDDQRGLAHFVEHMLFNGTRRFAKNDIISYLESIGVRFGADLNAYTGFDETVYILPVPTDKPGLVERSFDVLEDWASGALFDSTEVVNERGVVLEEWRSGLGADARIRDKQWPVLFQGSRYAARLPIGDTATLKTATPAPLKRFYRDWYRPDLMAVVAVGDYEPDRLEALIRERFGALRGPAQPRPRPTAPVPGHAATLTTIASDREQQLSSVQVLYKHPPAPLVRRSDYRTLLARRLYNRMLNDRLTEISRQTNAPFAFASSSYGPFVRSTDVYFLAAVVEDTGVVRGLEAILNEAKRVDQHGFLASELQRAKAATLRSLESAYQERDKTESGPLAEEYVALYLTGEPSPGIAWEFETAKQVLPDVTLEEVNALGRRWITDANRVIAVAAPEKADLKPLTEAELLAAFRRADGATVAAYTETVSEAPLVAVRPTAGRIAQEARIEELNVTDWRLSNGARVLVKATDFKADEVLLRAFSPGGLSLVSDADYVSGALATTILERGGLGDFSAIELGKKLAGKRAGVGGSIGSLSEGFTGQASPRDLETMLQLLYLKMTAPRRDSAAFEVLRNQFSMMLANRATSPDAAFSDTILVTMGGHHARARPLTAEMLKEASLDRALSIYQDRFSDAADFTFVIVGAVNVDSLRPIVEQWIGGLPASRRGEQWRDVGMRAPTGVVERTVRKGVEPKSQTVMLFTGDTRFSPETRYAIRSLSELLEMKLLETLREALGSTYSVGVSGQASRNPREEYQIVINFQSSPENADALFRSVMAVIDSVKTNGATDADVQKVREQQQRTLEVSLKENGYWSLNLAARIENGEDPRGLLTYGDFIRNLSGEQIGAAARRFLNPGRYARFVLLPEK